MKKSIKLRFTVTFIIVIICCIGSIFLFNTVFLEKLYINNKKNIIKQSYYALENGISEAYDMGYSLADLFKRRKSENSSSDESNLSKFLRELQEIYGVSAFLMDSNNRIYSLFQNNTMFDRRIKEYIYGDFSNNKSIKVLEKNELYTMTIHDISIGFNIPSQSMSKRPPVMPRKDLYIECFGFLSDNETVFFLTIPIDSIKESIVLFNQILVLVSIVIILIGSIAIYLISNNLVKPLLQLSEISKKMSNLEFENKYECKSEDEIGVLGNSMNELSFKLEKSIKELKSANLQLKADIEKKEQIDHMRQEFVANVSHELKTPIALISGYAEGLETDGIADSKEKRDYYISVIKDETEKMNGIVRQLLNLSELERGNAELDISRINLKEIVLGVSNTFDIKLKEKNINLSIDIPDDIYIWADGFKVEEVIKNYLSNAINHVDDNKIIKLYIKQTTHSFIRFSVFNSGKQLNDEDISKVWEKFYKVDKAHTRSYGGTGLGLSIVKAIAEQHDTVCGCENTSINSIDGVEFYFDFSIK